MIKFYGFRAWKSLAVVCLIIISSVMLAGCSSSEDSDSRAEAEVSESFAVTEKNDLSDDVRLEEYRNRLKDFNNEHGTDYSFPESQEGQEWLLSLSTEQFDSYLMSVYDGSVEDVEKPMLRNDDAFMGVCAEEKENSGSGDDEIYRISK